jgi:DNA-binding response OmpR family regulator
MATLLLSDESPTVQRLIAMTFADQDIQVTSVTDGEEAIARMSVDRPDIVLASIATPRRSGYDVAAFVKSAPALASIPVLLLAAAFEPVDDVRVAQVRADGVLVKPLDPRLVVTRVKALLDRSPVAGPAGEPPHVTALPTAPAAPTAESPDEGGDYFARLDAAIAQRAPLHRPASADDVGTVPTVDDLLKPGTAAAPTVPPSAPVVSEALVDAVTRQVVERLGPGAVRDVVADVVADVAERLIREEIARIRRKL